MFDDITQKFINSFENLDIKNQFEFFCNCIYCGKSKHNKPHLGINLAKKIFHCFRCNESGTLRKLIKEMYTEGLIDKKTYYEFIKHFYNVDFDESIKKYVDKINKYSVKKIKIEKITSLWIKKYIKERLNLDYDDDYVLQKILFQYKDNLAIKRLNTILTYNKNKEKKKIKVNNTYMFDAFVLTKYKKKNLIVCEGEFDALTLYFNYIDSDIIALGNKNYSNILKILLQKVTHKIYYENLIIAPDNDTSNKEVLNKLNKIPLKFYDNIFILRPKTIYKDFNEQFIKENYQLNNLRLQKIK